MSAKTLTESLVQMAQATDNLKMKRRRLAKAVNTGMTETGWGLRRLARQTRVAPSYLCHILKGSRQGPGPDKYLIRAATALVTQLKNGRHNGKGKS